MLNCLIRHLSHSSAPLFSSFAGYLVLCFKDTAVLSSSSSILAQLWLYPEIVFYSVTTYPVLSRLQETSLALSHIIQNIILSRVIHTEHGQ